MILFLYRGGVLDGELPIRILNMVCEWIEINKDELLEMWETQEFKKLSPLK